MADAPVDSGVTATKLDQPFLSRRCSTPCGPGADAEDCEQPRLLRSWKSTPARPIDHMCLLSPAECLTAMSSGHLDQGWLLQDESPTMPSPARGANVWDRFLKPGAVCLFLILVNANDTILKSVSQQRGKALAGERYLPSSVMLVSNLISVLIGNALCFLNAPGLAGCPGLPLAPWQRVDGLSHFWVWDQLLQMSVPAVCFTLSGTLKFVALGLVPPDVVVTLEQSTVLLCALMGWAWLGKRYSRMQVLMLMQVTCGFLWYQSAEQRNIGRSEVDASECLSHFWLGLSLMSCSVVMVTAGGLSCEKLLKGSQVRPFYIQKAQMEFSMAVAGLFYCLLLQPLLQGSNPLLELGLFHGWDSWTVWVLALHTCKSWLATTVVRMLDNLTFTLAGNAAMLLVYMERLALLSEDAFESFRLEVFVSLCCTAIGVGGFAVASARRHEEMRLVSRRRRKAAKTRLAPLEMPLLRHRSNTEITHEEALGLVRKASQGFGTLSRKSSVNDDV
mmetsp:Transcript_104398/g.322098  ORF Transcript_104398/g.322098 Transcript_104398/m.322098 type:complete len:503 (+) Transcript_104398:47-1555(+)